jgi:type IV pilus assembly protein PilB
MAQRKLLGKILEETGVVKSADLKTALKKQMDEPGKKIGELLVEMGACTARQITEALALQYEYPLVDLKVVPIDQELIHQIPRGVCDENKVIPIRKNGNVITIATADPMDFFMLDNLKFVLNMDIDTVLAPAEDIQEAIVRYYGGEKAVLEGALGEAIEAATLTQSDIAVRSSGLEDNTTEADDAPVIKFVQLMITDAITTRASDIHVEPMEDRVRIRFRIDGICKEVNAPPKRLQAALISRLKIMADMDIAEKRKCQDGRIAIKVAGRALDIRVSGLPATHGESIVMRLLDKQAGLMSLEELGFHPSDYKRFRRIIKRPNGIFLVTGPTGSGKTTTLYAALRELNRPDVKIITAENPVEYNIAGINQAQVKAHIGMTFQRILRAMLRQAPNIILVGEIRDTETAEIAIQAALTGHLVFSTLHTNDAPSAITRLIDMGVKPFLVASAIQAVMGQRLVRILCPQCKQPDKEPDPFLMKALGIKPEDVKGRDVMKPVGCDNCKGGGYRGRKGIYELMEMNATLRDLAFKKAAAGDLREQARLAGMVTLLEDGVRKVFDGQTSMEEVLSITHREDISY